MAIHRDPAQAALGLARLGIAVIPGTHATPGGACSCGNRTCRSEGRHPIDPAWLLHATTDRSTILEWWGRHPEANVITPLTGPFHIVDAPPLLGSTVLHWLGGKPGFAGPITVTPEGRYHFWTTPGIGIELGVLLDRRGYLHEDIDLIVHREGTYVLAPPSRIGAGDDFRWVSPPRTHVDQMPHSGMLLRLLIEACRDLRGSRDHPPPM